MEIEKRESALIQELLNLLNAGKVDKAKSFIRGRDMRRFTSKLEDKKKDLLGKLPAGSDDAKKIEVFVNDLIKALSPYAGEVPKLLKAKEPDVEKVKKWLKAAYTNLSALEAIEDKLGELSK